MFPLPFDDEGGQEEKCTKGQTRNGPHHRGRVGTARVPHVPWKIRQFIIPDNERISNSLLPISTPNPMFGHLLESTKLCSVDAHE